MSLTHLETQYHVVDNLVHSLDLAMVQSAADVLAAATTVHCTGVGKSGLVAQKLASILRAHGVAAHFLDPVNALHGDIGGLETNDALVAVSASGSTSELMNLAEHVGGFDVGLYGELGELAHYTRLIIRTWGDPSDDKVTGFVPSASFTAASIVADELALRTGKARGGEGLAKTHPGGSLGETRPWE